MTPASPTTGPVTLVATPTIATPTPATPTPATTTATTATPAPATTAAIPATPTPATTPAPVATTGAPQATTAAPPVTNDPAPQAQAGGAGRAIATAEAQIGKPYQWGGAGPSSYDCSGLVMVAWASAGVYFPHLAQDQYDMTERIPLSSLLPGDLVFFGTPTDVYHVGMYVGGGEMVDAPSTGQNVQIQSMYWSGLLGAGRVVA